MSTEPIARRLAERLVTLRERPLPAAVAGRATELLLDFLGVALGGAPEPSSAALRRGLDALGYRGGCTVVGTTGRLPAPQAAMANGAAAHALEMDDTHQGGSIHLGASVFPAALAAAELRGASGASVLVAAAAGYDVAARAAMALGPAAHYARGFHLTGTCGAFGAAAAAGMVLDLDAEQLAAALGIAGTQAAGSMEFLADGAWTKRLNPGWAASAGLHAAALAAGGFTGPATVFEGRFGFLHAYSDRARPEPLVADDGWELLRTAVKPHACCRYMQGPIDAALALRAMHGIVPGDVEAVDVGMLAAGIPIVCEPAERKRRPASVVDAQFSLPFGVAVALARGAASPAEFSPEVLADPVVGDLMDRVAGIGDATLDAVFPRTWPTWVRIRLSGGRTVEQRVTHPLGDPDNFPSAAALRAKFRSLAARVLRPAGVERALAAAEGFADAARASELLTAAVAQ
jgi:2-methylcitrate dehydratase PrpD